jgi:hypothetical protein
MRVSATPFLVLLALPSCTTVIESPGGASPGGPDAAPGGGGGGGSGGEEGGADDPIEVLTSGPLPEARAREILAGCPASATYKMKTLSLRYIPTVGDQVDQDETDLDTSLAELRAKIDLLEPTVVQGLELGSTYRPMADPTAGCSLDYEIVDTVEYLEALPPTEDTTFPDYIDVLEREDICDWVDNKGVREVWLWGYHTDVLAPVESNMAGPNGDISNSYRTPDMPVCGTTYVLYNYNYGRGLGEALENHGHQIEAVLGHLDEELFQTRFVRDQGKTGGARNGCGNVHIPPNATTDYDWTRPTEVTSDCDDWRPDRAGATTTVSCETWGCPDDGGASWKIYWMNHLPGRDNGLSYGGETLRSWWVAIGDFDAVTASGTRLVQP